MLVYDYGKKHAKPQNIKYEKKKKYEFQLFIMQFNLILSKPSPKKKFK
jgi:hypothetical protein